MNYKAVIAMCLFVLMVVCGACNRTEPSPTRTGKAVNSARNYVKMANALSQHHYGINAIHDVYVEGTSLIMDLNNQIFEHKDQPVDEQVESVVDDLRVNSAMFNRLDIYSIKVFIEGVFYNKYSI